MIIKIKRWLTRLAPASIERRVSSSSKHLLLYCSICSSSRSHSNTTNTLVLIITLADQCWVGSNFRQQTQFVKMCVGGPLATFSFYVKFAWWLGCPWTSCYCVLMSTQPSTLNGREISINLRTTS